MPDVHCQHDTVMFLGNLFLANIQWITENNWKKWKFRFPADLVCDLTKLTAGNIKPQVIKQLKLPTW